MKNKLLALALAAGCTFHAHAAEIGKSQSLTSPDQVPEGLEKSDWQSIRQAYHAAQFRSAVNAGPTTQQAYLKASNTGAYDFFGSSVAVSGDTVVVGAWRECSSTNGVNSVPDEGGVFSGAAYVFTRSGGIWSQQAYLKASNTGVEDRFGFSVAVAGDTIVVGAVAEDSSTSGVNSIQNDMSFDSGAAYVFTRSSGTWTQQAYLKASNTGENDVFGWSVAVSGDTIVVGAYGEDSSTTGVNSVPNIAARNSGAAYVFARSGSTWSQQAYLKASNTGAMDYFGRSVSVSGDTIVVGAGQEGSSTTGVNSVPNEAASRSGAAYVFTRSVGGWSQQAYLKASNSGQFDYFGTSVAVAGDTVVVGANFEASSTIGVNSVPNEAGPSSGAAYVFIRSGSTWSQQAYLKASNPWPGSLFGSSVAVAGGTVVIGAVHEASSTSGVNSVPNKALPFSGAAYVFTRSGVTWSQQAYLKASNPGGGNPLGKDSISQGGDNFGTSVAVSGNTVISGAYLEDSTTSGINTVPNDAGAADNSGAAYIFTLPAVVKFQVSVKLNPAKIGEVTGSGSFATGSKVTLKAKAKKGHKFLGWYEKRKLISKRPVFVIKSLTANRSLLAKFK